MLPISLYTDEKIKIRGEYISTEKISGKKEYMVLYTTFINEGRIIENQSRFEIVDGSGFEEGQKILKLNGEFWIYRDMLCDLGYDLGIARYSHIDMYKLTKKWIDIIVKNEFGYLN